MTSISFLSRRNEQEWKGLRIVDRHTRPHCRRETHVAGCLSLSLISTEPHAHHDLLTEKSVDVASSWLRMQQYRAVSRLVCILLLLLRFSSSIE